MPRRNIEYVEMMAYMTGLSVAETNQYCTNLLGDKSQANKLCYFLLGRNPQRPVRGILHSAVMYLTCR